jgi:hypothetical protein
MAGLISFLEICYTFLILALGLSGVALVFRGVMVDEILILAVCSGRILKVPFLAW